MKVTAASLVDVEECTYTQDSKDSSSLSHYAYTLRNPGAILTLGLGLVDTRCNWDNWVTGLLPFWKTTT